MNNTSNRVSIRLSLCADVYMHELSTKIIINEVQNA